MSKRVVLSVIAIGLVLVGVLGSSDADITHSENLKGSQVTTEMETPVEVERVTPTCDGTTVSTNCVLDDVKYTKYIYHPAVAEVSHVERTTVYNEKIIGYCTLCNDGTYSPSCATGRGACSHHGGVNQWNAPKYQKVPEYFENVVVDTPAQLEYFEKVIDSEN